MAITVRRITTAEADIETFRRVRLAALADAPHAFSTTLAEARAFAHSVWAERAADSAEGGPNTTVLAFDGDGGCVGLVAGIGGDDEGPVELVSMWTDPRARGCGAGRALVDAVLAWAGPRPVELWVMRDNASAIGFYERCGFVRLLAPEADPDDPCRDEIRMRHEPIAPVTGDAGTTTR